MTSTAAHPIEPGSGLRLAAVIFDMDGVVTDTAGLHATAWKTLFDATLPILAGDRDTAPFDIDGDYHAHIDGRSREDGVRALLASRDLRLPDGAASDPAGTLSVHGLAARKQQIFAEQVAAHGVRAYPSTVALLHRLKSQGVAAGLVTASRNSDSILAAAAVTDLFATVVDGTDAIRLGLRGKPAPDMFCAAADRLGVPPAQAVVIEDAEAGVRAAVAGGFGRVIGVDRGGNRARLAVAGADLVVDDLAGIDVIAPVLDPAPWCGGPTWMPGRGCWPIPATIRPPNQSGKPFAASATATGVPAAPQLTPLRTASTTRVSTSPVCTTGSTVP